MDDKDPSDVRDFHHYIRLFAESVLYQAESIILPKAVNILGGLATEFTRLTGGIMLGVETPDDFVRLADKAKPGGDNRDHILGALQSLEDYAELLYGYPDTTDATDLIVGAINLLERMPAIIEPNDLTD